eukprot:TRINITY_DN31583_c0_g1_i2.p1 TRINITY_DN31583_c0_g1~~TRINITY_DN31583_c0_g1_i2.p1  ORF type:complete len:110 (-),score=13.36 TRINITY_DN31583_c0_g1_i2:86-415(-)
MGLNVVYLLKKCLYQHMKSNEDKLTAPFPFDLFKFSEFCFESLCTGVAVSMSQNDTFPRDARDTAPQLTLLAMFVPSPARAQNPFCPNPALATGVTLFLSLPLKLPSHS